MTATGDSARPRGIRLYWLVVMLGALVLVLALAVGRRVSESARRAQIVPGVGAMDVETGQPYGSDQAWLEQGPYAKGAGRGMRGGGAAGARAMAQRAAEAARGAGFEVRPAAQLLPTATRMLIRIGNLRLRVENVARAHEEVARIAREANGYVATTSLSSEQGPTYAVMTLRLPAEGLDSVIARVSALGKVLSKEINTEEVTEEYVDLSSRRRNLEREEERLLELLKRTGKISDLLEVEQTLARVRGEIEQISGRMRYLENRVALSTLTIHLEGPQPTPTTGGPVWTAKDVWRQAERSLLETGRGLATMGIWLAVFLPIWLPLVLVLIWLLRRAFPRPEESKTSGK